MSVPLSPIQASIRLTCLQSELEVDPRIYEHYLELLNCSDLRVLFPGLSRYPKLALF